MGLFERLGRNVETFRREVAAARDAEATHRCPDCGELFYTDQEDCPDCGTQVEPLEE